MAGDRVGVEFTCRLPGGEIAASTSAQVAADPKQHKSMIFMPKKGDGALRVIAGPGDHSGNRSRSLGFEEALVFGLTPQLVGMQEGGSRVVQVRADDLAGSHSVQMPLVRLRPKEWRVESGVYQSRTGVEPQVGQEFSMDPLVPGKVVEVAGGQVTVRFSAKDGAEVETAFGPATIRETPEQFQVVLHPRLGSLVRTGYIVGRVSKVDEQNFTVDYANPLGGETLSCEVKVATVAADAAAGKQDQ